MTVQEFCTRFSAELDSEFWGAIEPEIFSDLAGMSDDEVNKLDDDDDTKVMHRILAKILSE